MAFQVQFPERRPEKIVETKLMKRIAGRTVAIQPEGALIVWTGRHRLGKTKTAEWLRDRINEADDPSNENAFRATHYEVGKIRHSSGSEAKQGIRSLYHHLIGPLDEGVYRKTPPEGLALQLVHGIEKKRIGMIFVDEAGLLSLDAIGGMVLVRDVAINRGYPFAIVFIGMDDLPGKLEMRPQIRGRVMEWCYFKPYDLDDTWDMLAELHPHFARLDRKNPASREQVEFIHQTYGGVPGEIVPFLRKLDRRSAGAGKEIDLFLLTAVHLATERDRRRAIQDAAGGYAGVVPKDTEEESKQTRRDRKRGKAQTKLPQDKGGNAAVEKRDSKRKGRGGKRTTTAEKTRGQTGRRAT